MSTYTAPTITDASALSSTEINDALGHGASGLAEAINGAIDVNNISGGSVLKAPHFLPGSITRVWEAMAPPGDIETLMVVLSGEPFGEHTNLYSPPDCAVRATTTATADVEVSAFIDLHVFKHSWTSISDFSLDLQASLMNGDVALRTVDVEWSVAASTEHRSVPLRIDAVIDDAAAGTYDFWLRLDFDGSSGAGGTTPELVQCYGSGRGIRVEAFYK